MSIGFLETANEWSFVFLFSAVFFIIKHYGKALKTLQFEKRRWSHYAVYEKTYLILLTSCIVLIRVTNGMDKRLVIMQTDKAFSLYNYLPCIHPIGNVDYTEQCKMRCVNPR